MSSFVVRPYAGPSDLLALHELARTRTASRFPERTYYHPGNVSWRLVHAPADDDTIPLWLEDEQVAGWAVFDEPHWIEMDYRPGPEGLALAREILTWGEARARAAADRSGELPRLELIAFESDTQRAELLAAGGYVRGDVTGVLYRRSLATPIPGSQLPAAWTVRSPRGDELDARALAHREAWNVWGPSKFTLERYQQVRELPNYEPEFDLVVVEPGGIFVSCLIAWPDDATGTGLFEPVGTHVGYTRRGLAREAMYEAMRRMRARGLHTAFVGTAQINLPARATYPACGFDEVDQEILWTKDL